MFYDFFIIHTFQVFELIIKKISSAEVCKWAKNVLKWYKISIFEWFGPDAFVLAFKDFVRVPTT